MRTVSIVMACVLLSASLQAQTIFFIAQNPVLIPGSPQRFQYEVWMRASEAGHRVGSVIIYNNYNPAVFGTGAASAGRITVTKNEAVFGALYGLNPVNDNTGSRFAFSWTYLGTAGAGVMVTNSILGVLAFTVQITVTGNASLSSGITFDDGLMAGEQFKDDELTAWTNNLGISFIENGPLPVQLSTFTALRMGNAVQLRWTTLSELNNYGFYVQRKRVNEQQFTDIPENFVAGNGTTSVPQHYTFTDPHAGAGAMQYRLKQVDLDGAVHFTDPVQVESPTSVKEAAPRMFALEQNYPNPFNPSTEIRFAVEQAGTAALRIYDLTGREVLAPFVDHAEPGRYYTVRVDGLRLATGTYFYRLTSGGKTEQRIMLLLK